jgi:transposase
MKEADRLKVIWQVITGKLRIKEAAAKLFLSRRQVIRIRNRVKAEGNAGIIHRRRGKPSNHRLPQGLIPGQTCWYIAAPNAGTSYFQTKLGNEFAG